MTLVKIEEGTPVVDTRTIAQCCDVEHRSLYKLLTEYTEEMEAAFNQVRFQIADGFELPQGGRAPGQRFALLTEDQATFLITLTRNTPKVVAFKAALVRAFSEAKKKLAGHYLPQTKADALRALADAEEEKERLALENVKLNEDVERMAPKEQLFDAAMSSNTLLLVRDAAKLLNDSIPGGIGERRLFAWLRTNKWIFPGTNKPYQSKIDAGYLSMREMPVLTRSRGTIVNITPYVTQRGLEALRRSLVKSFAGGVE